MTVVGFAAIVAVAMWRAAPRIELQLTKDVAVHALVDLPEVQVRFDGRDAILSGRVPSGADRASVIAAVQRRWGVRVVRAGGLVAVTPGVIRAPRTGEQAGPGGPLPTVARPVGPTVTRPTSTSAPTTAAPTTTSAPTTVAPTTPALTTIPAAVFDALDLTLSELLAEAPIRFTKSSAAADAASSATLDAVAGALIAAPGPVVRIDTHTDGSGSAAANLFLSQKRADALRDDLISRGVPAERIVTQGFGESEPIASDNSDSGRQRNRRVEIHSLR